jgi:hypothetical protein
LIDRCPGKKPDSGKQEFGRGSNRGVRIRQEERVASFQVPQVSGALECDSDTSRGWTENAL